MARSVSLKIGYLAFDPNVDETTLDLGLNLGVELRDGKRPGLFLVEKEL